MSPETESQLGEKPINLPLVRFFLLLIELKLYYKEVKLCLKSCGDVHEPIPALRYLDCLVFGTLCSSLSLQNITSQAFIEDQFRRLDAVEPKCSSEVYIM